MTVNTCKQQWSFQLSRRPFHSLVKLWPTQASRLWWTGRQFPVMNECLIVNSMIHIKLQKWNLKKDKLHLLITSQRVSSFHWWRSMVLEQMQVFLFTLITSVKETMSRYSVAESFNQPLLELCWYMATKKLILSLFYPPCDQLLSSN